MDTEFSYNLMQDAEFTDELDRRIAGIVNIAEDRVYHRVNVALNQVINYEDVKELTEQAISARDIEGTVRGVVMNVLREIGLVDDNYRAHEPTEVDGREFDAVLNG